MVRIGRRLWCGVGVLLLAVGCAAADDVGVVTVVERDAQHTVRDAAGESPTTRTFHEIVIENAYLRVTILPQLGGRVASVYDKAAQAEMFLTRPIDWPTTRYTAYGSQLGGIEVNFPCFHHGNSFLDQWHWLTRTDPDGSAVVFLAWTSPQHRQRVVHRLRLAPDSSRLESWYRFTNLNSFATGFAPWTNTFFGYSDDLQYIIPTRHVVPHGFNDFKLDTLDWPWPKFDDDSVCYWRNITGDYTSVFALEVQGDFHGVYYHEADRGMVRTFDRTRMPGIKLYNVPPDRLTEPKPTDYLEIWTSPALLHEDASWWEGYAVREYDEAYYPVHGLGGYRFANDAAALNLERDGMTVEIGVLVTQATPGAVVTLTTIDGVRFRHLADLSPAAAFRAKVADVPTRAPVTLTVADAAGVELARYSDEPDPAPNLQVGFDGKPLWRATAEQAALKAEQYQPLWRGRTGGYGRFGEPGIRAWQAILDKQPDHLDARLGLVRSLLMDAQLRTPDQPGAGSAEQIAALRAAHLKRADELLDDVDSPRAHVLAGEVALRRGDAAAALRHFKAAGEVDAAAVGAAIALARLGRADEALAHSARAMRSLARSSFVAQVHAGLLIEAGRPVEAVRLLDALDAADPVDMMTLHLLARAHETMDDRAMARMFTARLRALLAQTDQPAALSPLLPRFGFDETQLTGTDDE